MNDKKILLHRYIRAVTIPVSCSLCIFLFFYLYSKGESTAFVDAIQLSGFIILLAASFLFITNLGAFDFLVFSVTRLFARLFPWRNVNMQQTYYDYVEGKKEARLHKLILWPTFVLGIILIVIGFFFY